MLIRKCVVLSLLVMATGIYGFGSSDLAEMEGLLSDIDNTLVTEVLHASSTREERRNALNAARAKRASIVGHLLLVGTNIALECSIVALMGINMMQNQHAK